MVPMPVSMHCVALCGSNRGLSLHLMVLATPTLAMGKGKVAKGKVTKPAKKDMDVKGKEHKLATKSMNGSVHVMKKSQENKQWACLCPMVRRRLSQ